MNLAVGKLQKLLKKAAAQLKFDDDSLYSYVDLSINNNHANVGFETTIQKYVQLEKHLNNGSCMSNCESLTNIPNWRRPYDFGNSQGYYDENRENSRKCKGTIRSCKISNDKYGIVQYSVS